MVTTEVRAGPLRLSTADPSLARWLEGWRHWAARWDGAAGAVLDVRWQRGRVDLAAVRWRESLWGDVRAGLVDGQPVFLGAGGAVCIEPGTAVVDGVPVAEDPAWHLLLEAALFELLGGAGCICVHGGAVAVDGAGWLVAGDSGAGKSTFVYLAGAAGAEAVSDDVTLLRRSGEGWWACGTSSTARLAPAPHLPEIRKDAHLDERGKVRLVPPRSCGRAPLTGILLLETPPGGRSRKARLHAGEALGALLGQAALAMEPAAASAQCDLLSELVTHVPVWRARAGSALLEDAGRTLDLLVAP